MFVYLNDGTGTKIVFNLLTLQLESIRSTDIGRLGITDFCKKSILYNDGKFAFLLCKNENAPYTVKVYAKNCFNALYTMQVDMEPSRIMHISVNYLKRHSVFEVDISDNKKGYACLLYRVNNTLVKPIYKDKTLCPIGSTLAIDNNLNVTRRYNIVNTEESAREYAEQYGIVKYRVKGYKIIYNKCSRIGHITWQHSVDLRTLEHTSKQLGRYDYSSEINGA